MLRMLVDFFSGVVRVLAIVAIFGGAVVGFLQSGTADVEPWAGALIGFAAGFLAASVFCGLLACIILIEGHLRVLADAKKAEMKKPQPAERTEQTTPLDPPDRVALYTRPYQPPAPPPLEPETAQAKQDEKPKVS